MAARHAAFPAADGCGLGICTPQRLRRPDYHDAGPRVGGRHMQNLVEVSIRIATNREVVIDGESSLRGEVCDTAADNLARVAADILRLPLLDVNGVEVPARIDARRLSRVFICRRTEIASCKVLRDSSMLT